MQRPTPFGKYLLLDRIGMGGMAEVFRAKTQGVEGFARLVAIKRILPHLAEDSRFVEMFVSEAKLASRLRHANIAQVIELDRVGGEHFIVMEYVGGRDLLNLRNHLRRRDETLPIELAAYIVAQVAQGLAHAHDLCDESGQPLHIVHRDISPQNILVSFEGAVKLIDFGIARAATDRIATRAGVLKGKYAYMSPEQVENQPTDARSDLFSLGAVLYELLTNERLFEGSNEFITLEKVREAKASPPSQLNPNVPAALDDIVLKALARDPRQRFPHAAAFEEALTRFIYSLGQSAPTLRLRAWMREHFPEEIAREHERELHARRFTLSGNGELIELPSEVIEQDEDEETALWTPDFDDLDQIVPPALISNALPAQAGGALAYPTLRAPAQHSVPPQPRAAQASSPSPQAPSQTLPPRSAPPAATHAPKAGPPERWSLDLPSERPTVNLPRAQRPRKLGWITFFVLVIALAAVASAILLRPKPAELSLEVSPPAGLAITLNGDPLLSNAQSPLRLSNLAEGHYEVRIEKPGYQPMSTRVKLSGGQSLPLSLRLEPLSQRAVRLNITPPEAELFINGQPVPAVVRAEPIALTPQQPLQIKLTAPGYAPLERMIFYDEQTDPQLNLQMSPALGQIVVTTRPPGAQVRLNGEAVGQTPFVRKDLDTRQVFKLRLELAQHEPIEEELRFGEQRRLQIAHTLKPSAP